MVEKDNKEKWCIKDEWSLKNLLLIGIFGWNNSHIALIEISLPITLYCNVMITGLVDHGLHVILHATAMSSSSFRFIVATTSSLLYRLGSTSALALSGTKVPRIACKPKQFALIVGSRRLLADQRLFGHGQAWLLGRWHQLLLGRPGSRVTL